MKKSEKPSKSTKTSSIILEVGVKAFIKRDDGKYLVLQRSTSYPDDRGKKRWDIPGGRINPGEELEKALRREIKEETSLTLEEIEKILAAQDILRNNGRHTVRITFLAKCSGEVKINPREHKEFQWITLEELKNLEHDTYLTPVLRIFNVS